ncbi:MAG: hypothetical protein DBX55_10205 [Verrucomicrobia bacterium]|nr:MAG: hypothetical protein DBX55_10205 [Verrucomicrobiota bacterium]
MEAAVALYPSCGSSILENARRRLKNVFVVLRCGVSRKLRGRNRGCLESPICPSLAAFQRLCNIKAEEAAVWDVSRASGKCRF